MGNQLMLERHAGRAVNRQKTFGQLLESQRQTASYGEDGDITIGLGGVDDEAKAAEFAEKLNAARQRMAALPKSQIAQDFEAVAMAEGASLGEALANFARATVENPAGGLAWALETAGESAPQLIAAITASAATRNPGVGLSVMGGGSYLTERREGLH